MLKKVLKIIGIVMAVVIALVAILLIAGKIFESSISSGVDIYLPGITEDEAKAEKLAIDEKMRQIPSDVDGLTMYEKKEMGLNPYDEDTDYDGLSDNDEINVYGSDPLKRSTAGDFYSDGYKVKHKMDLFTSYEYDGDFTCENVYVEGVNPIVNNLDEATIQVYPDYISLEDASKAVGKTVYKSIRVTNKNKVPIEIEFSDIVNENEISIDDITVINCESTQFYDNTEVYKNEEADYSVNGNSFRIQYSDEIGKNGSYNIIIVKKESDVLGNLLGQNEFLSAFLAGDNSEAKRIADKEGLALGTATPIFRLFDWRITESDKYATIYYYDTGDEAINNRAINLVKTELARRLRITRSAAKDTFFELEKVSFDEIISKYNCNIPLLKDIWKKFEYQNGEPDTFLQSLHSYVLSSNLEPTELEDAKFKSGTKSGFMYDEEIFPFTNFISERQDNGKTIGGHCAAIATITAKAHNGSYVTPTGEWTSLAAGENTSTAFFGTKSWNILVDSENSTLMDKNLVDFKSSDFVDSKGRITEESIGASEFINLADCYLEEYNNYSKKFCDSMNYSGNGIDKYPYYNVENMMKYIDSGKILVIGFLDCKMGHVVNAYDYEEDGESIVFSIYDNNHPENKDLKLIIKHSDYPYYMDFSYTSPDHTWSSETSSYYKMIVTDENMHFITDVRRLQDEEGNIEAMTHNYDIANREIDKIRG